MSRYRNFFTKFLGFIWCLYERVSKLLIGRDNCFSIALFYVLLQLRSATHWRHHRRSRSRNRGGILDATESGSGSTTDAHIRGVERCQRRRQQAAESAGHSAACTSGTCTGASAAHRRPATSERCTCSSA